jgi:hypothetical protein
MRDLKPCSKVFDNEAHEPHTYYHAGHDVRCLGYSPIRTVSSNDAETPEEFFGINPITKHPEPDVVAWMRNEMRMMLDVVLDAQRDADDAGFKPAEIAEELDIPIEFVSKILEGEVFVPYGEPLNKAQLAVLWYEDLRPIKKDLVMLVIASVIFSILFIVIQSLFS